MIELKNENYKQYELSSNELIHDLMPEFYDKYPWILDKLIKDNDITELIDMLEKLHKVELGELTLQEAERKMTVQLGRKYLDKPDMNINTRKKLRKILNGIESGTRDMEGYKLNEKSQAKKKKHQQKK